MKSRHPKLQLGALLALGALTLAAAPATETDDPSATEVAAEEPTAEEPTAEEPAAEEPTAEAEAPAEEEPDASATAVEVEDVVVISQATASEDSASATVLEVGGERVVGGDADGGSSAGAVFDSGDTELGRLAVAPWSAETGSDGSRSQASVVEVTVIGEDTFYAHVLRSRAAADSGGGTAASSDAVAFGIGGEDEVRVLSSVWTADGPESALVRQGDDTIGEDTEGQCQLEVPSLLHLLCLTGVDGNGGTLVPGDNEDAEYASVAEVVAVDELGVATLRAGGERSTAVTDPAPEQETAESPDPSGDTTPGADTELAAAPTPSQDGTLPRTGGGVTLFAAGLLLLAFGAVLRRQAPVTA